MNKILLIIQREYLTRVRKRSFLLTTILVPLVIIGFYAAILAVAMSDSSDDELIAVIDEANLFGDSIEPEKNGNIKYEMISGESFESFQKKYDEKGYSALLHIPQIDLNNPRGIQLHSKSALSIPVKNKVEGRVDRAIEQKRLLTENIDPKKYASIHSNISIENRLDSSDGEKKSVEGVAYVVAFASGILIYMILLIYGSMVMRGVMEEKTNRISEVVISSVKPFQLMMGKIIGIGAVGITQFIIWIVLIGLLQFIIPVMFPSIAGDVPQAAAAGVPMANEANMLSKITDGLQAIPMGLLLICFLFYFLGGYLMYASLFAAIGSVSEDVQEAQQLVFPVMMPIILGFVMLTKAIQDPNSGMALFGSLFPLTSPIVMLGRIPFGVPWTELILSMVLLILFFLFCTWLAGRIYRTGILMYGKKGSWKEMAKWAFRRS